MNKIPLIISLLALITACSGGQRIGGQSIDGQDICTDADACVESPIDSSSSSSSGSETPVTTTPAENMEEEPQVQEPQAQEPKVVYAINAGGGTVTTAEGVVYEGDGYARNANTFASAAAQITGTDNPALYQTEAWAKQLSYALPVTNDTYDVTLHFAEIAFAEKGKRVFAITIEGEEVEGNVDLFNIAGKNKAVDFTFTDINVTDGELNINIEGAVENGKLSALLVESLTGKRTAPSFSGGIETEPFVKLANRPVLRIPGFIQTKSGRLIAGIEARESSSDHSEKEVMITLSDDGGKSWYGQKILGDRGSSPTGNPTFVFDDEINRLFIFYAAYDGTEHTARNLQVYYRYSDNHGRDWSNEVDITDLIPDAFFLALPGPGHGIQMKNAHQGRLVVPFWGNQPAAQTIFGIYSDDNGKTWQLGYQPTLAEGMAYAPNETQIVEQANGDLLIISRTGRTQVEFSPGMVRAKSISQDGGQTIGPLVHSSQFSGPVVMGSVLSHEDTIVYSSPLDPDGRNRMGLRESFDGGQSFGFPHQTTSLSAAYSDLAYLDQDTFGMLIETAGSRNIIFKSLNRSVLATNTFHLTDNSNTTSSIFLYKNKEAGDDSKIVSDGAFGKSCFLNGNGYIHIPKTDENIIAGTAFTVSFWYRSNSDFSGKEALLWFFTLGPARDAMWARLYPTSVRTLVNSEGESVADLNISTGGDNQWHMITLVRNNDNLILYVDGKKSSTNANFFANNRFGMDTDFGYYFGARPNNRSESGYSEFFHGYIDEIQIYTQSLTDNEIADLYGMNTIPNKNQVVHVSCD